MPTERLRSGALTAAAPSLAACISPGPPPVTMSQPISASAAASRLTSSYAVGPGLTRAEAKIVTRYRSRLVGRRRERLLTMSHRPKTALDRTCLTASSSARLTFPGFVSGDGLLLMDRLQPHEP